MQLGAAAIDAATNCGTAAAGTMSAVDACVADRPHAGLPVIVLLLNRLAWSMSLVANDRGGGGWARESATARASDSGSDTDAEDGASCGPGQQLLTVDVVTADVRCPALCALVSVRSLPAVNSFAPVLCKRRLQEATAHNIFFVRAESLLRAVAALGVTVAWLTSASP